MLDRSKIYLNDNIPDLIGETAKVRNLLFDVKIVDDHLSDRHDSDA